MTVSNFEFSALTQSDVGGPIYCGDTFTMTSPGACITATDNDAFLSGDNVRNENANDTSYQTATIEGSNGELGNGGQIYAESYYWVHDQNGTWFQMVEIEQEGTGEKYYTFLNGDGYGTPAPGAELTVHSKSNVTNDCWLDYKCLDGGIKWELDPDCTYTIEAEDMQSRNYKVVDGNQASGGELVKITANDGALWTQFGGESGSYDIKVCAQDETDGISMIKVFVDGVEVGVITLDQQNNGRGSNNGAFSEFVIPGVNINYGETVELKAWKNCGEYVRIDKVAFTQEKDVIETGNVCGRLTFDEDCNNNEWNEQTGTWDVGIGGQTIQLIDANGNVYAETTTRDDGFYVFNDVLVGDYQVKFPALDGYRFSEKDSGVAEHFDSDANPDGLTDLFHVGPDAWVDNIDAGLKNELEDGNEESTVCENDGLVTLTNVLNNTYDPEPGDPFVMAVWGDNGPAAINVGRPISGSNGGIFVINADGWITFDTNGDFDGLGSGDSTTTEIWYCVEDAAGTIVESKYTVRVEGKEELGSVAGRYFCDVDLDAIESNDDVGVPGAIVELRDANGLVARTTTADDGSYIFEGIAQGSYFVRFIDAGDAGKGFVLESASQAAGADDTNDSDVVNVGSAGNGNTAYFSIGEGENKIDVDGGIANKFRVCDDPDAMMLDFELAAGTVVFEQYEGVTITAQRAGDSPTSENDAMVFDSANPTGGDNDLATPSQGGVLIISEDNDASDPDDNASGGVITFDFEGPTTVYDMIFIDTEEPGGSVELFDANGDLIDSLLIPITQDGGIGQLLIDAVGVSQMVITMSGSGAIDNICYVPPQDPENACIYGRYFVDTNDNDIDHNNGDEPAVAGLTVQLFDTNGFVAETTTNADGTYSFVGLAAGDYSVKFFSPNDGRTFVTPDQVNDLVDSDVVAFDVDGNGQTASFAIGVSELVTNVDAGIEDPMTGSICGRYFCDTNDNSLDDGQATDPGIEEEEVFLLFADGTYTGLRTVTDSQGNYCFEGLAAGQYRVDFGLGIDQKIFVEQDVNNNANDDIDSDANALTGITDIVTVGFGEEVENIDAGIEDFDRPPETDCTFIIDGPITTEFQLHEMDDGSLMVTVKWLDVTNLTGDLRGVFFDVPDNALLNGMTITGGDVGNVVIDADNVTDVGNGSNVNGQVVQNFGRFDVGVEIGTPGISGDDIQETTFFISVPGVNFEAELLSNQDFGLRYNSVGEPGGSREGSLKIGGEAGVIVCDREESVITGRYFVDENGNDLDDGEPGVEGVGVRLLDGNGDPVLDDNGVAIATTTGAGGVYVFASLPAGTYQVAFDADPAGRLFVEQDANGNANDDIDSDVDQATGITDAFAVAEDEIREDIDAGVEDPGTGSITGRYFEDGNENEVEDPSDEGILNQLVTLERFDGTDWVFADSQNTDGIDGTYLFENLLADTYRVVFSPSGLSFVTPGVDDGSGNPEASDSDVELPTLPDGSGATAAIDLAAGQNLTDVDAGVADKPVLNSTNAADDEYFLEFETFVFDGIDSWVADLGTVGVDGLLDNDTDIQGDGQFITGVGTAGGGVGDQVTTTRLDDNTDLGQVVVNADGSLQFIISDEEYRTDPFFEGNGDLPLSVTFEYEITDDNPVDVAMDTADVIILIDLGGD